RVCDPSYVTLKQDYGRRNSPCCRRGNEALLVRTAHFGALGGRGSRAEQLAGLGGEVRVAPEALQVGGGALVDHGLRLLGQGDELVLHPEQQVIANLR